VIDPDISAIIVLRFPNPDPEMAETPRLVINYRNVFAWADRLRREGPFLDAVLGDAPARTLLDIGCGTGEHARHLAEQGWNVVGIELGEQLVREAQDLAGDTDAGGHARFLLHDAAEARALPEAPFGAAMCIGNGLAYVEDEAALDRFFTGVAEGLRPGAPFLMQMLNYERIVDTGMRTLGVNVRPMPDGTVGARDDDELVFLRLFRARPGERAVDFYPITLTLTPGQEPLVEVQTASEVVHYGWRRHEVESALRRCGFTDVRVLGTMAEVPFLPLESPDLVVVARRS
jgi:SAM-dependent methyltransferase